MLKQMHDDAKHYKKTGEIIKHETLSCTNRSGFNGTYRTVHPNGYSNPRIVWHSTWPIKNKLPGHKAFSTSDPDIKNEKDAENKAIAYTKLKRSKKLQ